MLILSVISFKINKIRRYLIYRCEKASQVWLTAGLFLCLTVKKYLSFFGKEPFPCLYFRTAGQQFFQLNQSPAFIAKLWSRCTADQRIAVLFQILCGKDFACPDPDHGPLAWLSCFPSRYCTIVPSCFKTYSRMPVPS